MAKHRLKMKLRLKVFIFAAIMLYVGSVLIQQEFKMRDQSVSKASLEKQIEEVKDQHHELTRKIEYARSDAHVEEVAREKLGWVKKGEIKYLEKKKE